MAVISEDRPMSNHEWGNAASNFHSYTITYHGNNIVTCIAIIGSDNGLSPGRRQAIIWTNADLLSIGPLEIYSTCDVKCCCFHLGVDPCVDQFLRYENKHARGGEPRPHISTLMECMVACMGTHPCYALDWEWVYILSFAFISCKLWNDWYCERTSMHSIYHIHGSKRISCSYSILKKTPLFVDFGRKKTPPFQPKAQ